MKILDYLMASKIFNGGGSAPVTLQDKTITENGTYTADEGYTGLGNVTVDVEQEIVIDDEELFANFKNTIEGGATDITLPYGFTKIGDRKFYEETNLVNINIPDTVTYIGASTFYGCKKIISILLPAQLTTVKQSAFMSCTGLKSVTFKGKPSSIANGSFSSCANLLTINVPWAEGEVANAPWGATNATINYNYTGE